MKINIQPLGNNCMGGNCPTVYGSDDGRFFIQGKVVDSEVSVSIPEGEMLVEVDREFLERLKQSV